MTSTHMLMFYLGGACALVGMLVTTWNKPESSAAEKDAMRAMPAVVTFIIVAAITVFWPALVLWLVAELAVEKREKP